VLRPTGVSGEDSPRRRGPGRRLAVRPGRLAGLLTLIVVAIIMTFPFYYLLSTSFTSESQYELGAGHSLSSWAALFAQVPVLREGANSGIVSVCSVMLIVAISVPAGFSLAKMPFRGYHVVFVGVAVCMLIPLPSIIIPEYVNFSRWGLVTSYTGAVLMYTGLGSPFAVFLMTTYFRGVPDQIFESARLDGASALQMLRYLAVPLAVPAIFTVCVLEFIAVWNDLLVALLFLQNPADRTLTAGLAVLSSGRATSIPVLMAGAVLSVIPASIVYIAFQKHLVQGLMVGVER
jgi:ABC-type glycerol-3-phosphate transport system permease component